MTTETLQEIHLRCQHVPVDESTVCKLQRKQEARKDRRQPQR